MHPGQSAPAPISSAVPVAPPSVTEAPAPSITTSAALFAPGRPPVGAPDLPPTTIPSFVPTPNISPPAPLTTTSQPAIAHIPQPGASAGAAGPAALPADINYAAAPRLLGDATALVSPSHTAMRQTGHDPASVPGGVATADADNLYFLHDRPLIHAHPTLPSI
jgi:cysteine desulfurase/selenocysteine lyase